MTDIAGRQYEAVVDGADPSGNQDSSAAMVATASALYAEHGGGRLRLPAGVYRISTPVGYWPNGVRIVGDGPGTTVLRADFSDASVLARVASSSSDSVEHIGLEELTIDCVGGPGGTVDAVAIDTSVSSAVVCRGVRIRNVEVIDGRLGIRSDGNNASAGPMNNQRTFQSLIVRNCLVGVISTGTYADHLVGSEFYGCTAAAVGTGGATPAAPAVNGQGPTTMLRLADLHVEGLGNLSGSGTATESGIYVGSSDPIISNVQISDVSRFGLCVSSGEGYAALIEDVEVWGAGFSGVYLTGGSSGQQGRLAGFSLYNVAQSSLANTAEQGAVCVGSGNWIISDGWIPTATEAPRYAVTFGADTNDAYDYLEFVRVHCPNPKTGWVYALGTQSGIVRFADCLGLDTNASPVTGAGLTPAVPAANTAVTNTTGLDCDVYISGFTAANISINGYSTGIGAGTFFLRAGATISLGAYTAAGTWAWIGR